jgi:hypothetical protein
MATATDEGGPSRGTQTGHDVHTVAASDVGRFMCRDGQRANPPSTISNGQLRPSVLAVVQGGEMSAGPAAACRAQPSRLAVRQAHSRPSAPTRVHERPLDQRARKAQQQCPPDRRRLPASLLRCLPVCQGCHPAPAPAPAAASSSAVPSSSSSIGTPITPSPPPPAQAAAAVRGSERAAGPPSVQPPTVFE